MKKLFVALLLCLLASLMVACDGSTPSEECSHKNLTETKHEPDCSREGYIQHLCLDCSLAYQSDFVKPLGHRLVSTVTEPTCTKEGYTTYACSACDYFYVASYTEPTGHTLTSKITPQTCTEEGYTTYSCPCGYSYRGTIVIPNGHNLSKSTVAPTCSVDGYDQYFCNNCDYAFQTNPTSRDHTYTKTVVEPTCTKEGYTHYKCDMCEYEYKTELVPPTGHVFSHQTIAPTFNTTGFTKHSCSCGFSYESDYVWYSNVFSGISGNKSEVFSHGVDLSYHNKTVNFKALAADGVDFVILRVAYDGHLDEKFEEYYAAAREAGLDIGAYIYSYATTVEDLMAYTNIVLQYLEGKTFEYPIYLDLEDDRQKALSEKTLMNMCTAYCELLVQNLYYPGIYSYRNFINEYMNAEQLATRFEVWAAHYLNADKNLYVDEYNMWQYSETETVNGVPTKVDMNYCYKDYPSIIKKYGYNGYGE